MLYVSKHRTLQSAKWLDITRIFSDFRQTILTEEPHQELEMDLSAILWTIVHEQKTRRDFWAQKASYLFKLEKTMGWKRFWLRNGVSMSQENRLSVTWQTLTWRNHPWTQRSKKNKGRTYRNVVPITPFTATDLRRHGQGSVHLFKVLTHWTIGDLELWKGLSGEK